MALKFKKIKKLQGGGYTGKVFTPIKYVPTPMMRPDPSLFNIAPVKSPKVELPEFDDSLEFLPSDTKGLQVEYQTAVNELNNLIGQYGAEAAYSAKGKELIRKAKNAVSWTKKAQAKQSKEDFDTAVKVVQDQNSSDRYVRDDSNNILVRAIDQNGEVAYDYVTPSQLIIGRVAGLFTPVTQSAYLNRRREDISGVSLSSNNPVPHSTRFNDGFINIENTTGLDKATNELDNLLDKNGYEKNKQVKEALGKLASIGGIAIYGERILESGKIDAKGIDPVIKTNANQLMTAFNTVFSSLSGSARNSFRQEALNNVTMRIKEDGFNLFIPGTGKVDLSTVSSAKRQELINKAIDKEYYSIVEDHMLKRLEQDKYIAEKYNAWNTSDVGISGEIGRQQLDRKDWLTEIMGNTGIMGAYETIDQSLSESGKLILSLLPN